MQMIQLGKSALRSSRVAYGCWRLAGVVEGAESDPIHQENGRRALVAAYEAGYTLFDHADIYGSGECENIFGRVLKEVPLMRDQILIATKCGIRPPGDPGPDAPYRYDSSAAHIIRSCEASLTRLGIETIDLFMLHRPDFLMEPDEISEAFHRLRKEGKAREFGISNFSCSQTEMLRKDCSILIAANQVEISLKRLDCVTDGTLDYCSMHRITPLAWSPLAGGSLGTDDPIDLRDPNHAHRLRIRESLDLIARAYSVNRSVIALAWLLKHPAQIVPIVGSTQPSKIQELARAETIELTREDWYRLLEAGLGHRLP